MNYSREEKFYIWCVGVELLPKEINELFSAYKSYEGIFNAFGRNDDNLNKLLENSRIYKISEKASERFLDNFLANLKLQNIKVLTKVGNTLPKVFSQSMEECRVGCLFAKGDLSLLDMPAVAIVGTRIPDNYGINTTANFAEKLCRAGFVIISGLASGVDTTAHTTALKYGCKTIAVIAGGFSNPYPKINEHLHRKIAEEGLLLSEYPPQVRPLDFQFPTRNRVIAALSQGVIITQMGAKSGALHTFNYALDYGREVFIVPGDINRERSRGNLNILREFPDCICVSPEDVISKLKTDNTDFETRVKTSSVNKKVNELNIGLEGRLIIEALKEGELTKNEILEKTNLDIKILNSYLTTLQIDEIIGTGGGNYFLKQ